MADQQPLHKPEKPARNEGCCSGYGVCKLVVIIYAVLFLLIGLLLLFLGIWIELLKIQYESINDVVTRPSILAILVGIIVIISAIIGIIGGLKENTFLLKFFLAVIIIVFIMQVVIGIIAFVYREKTENLANKQLQFAVEHYHEDRYLARAVDVIQKKYSCCGLKDGPEDWERNTNYSCTSDSYTRCGVPDSCCGDKEECGLNVRLQPADYGKRGVKVKGCTALFIIWVESHLDTVGATALGFSIPQILGIFLVYTFMQKVEDKICLFTYSKRMQHFEDS